MNKVVAVAAVLAIVIIGAAVWLAVSGQLPGVSTPSPEGLEKAAGKSIEIKGFAYQPSTITVQPGEEITVINRDLTGHSVTSSDGTSFDSGVLGQNKSAIITAPMTPGTYPFFCTPHPSIKGTLVVAGTQESTLRSVSATTPAFVAQSFTTVKAPHFVSSDPANNARLTTAPRQVTITFNFDLAPGSNIAVTRDGADVATGAVVVAADKLSMSRSVNASQIGNYTAAYTACWPDGSCHDGSFGFSVTGN